MPDHLFTFIYVSSLKKKKKKVLFYSQPVDLKLLATENQAVHMKQSAFSVIKPPGSIQQKCVSSFKCGTDVPVSLPTAHFLHLFILNRAKSIDGSFQSLKSQMHFAVCTFMNFVDWEIGHGR